MQYITPLAPAYAEVFLLVMVCAILLLDVFSKDEARTVTYALTLATLAGCFLITGFTDWRGEIHTFSGMFIADPMANFLKLGIYVAVANRIGFENGLQFWGSSFLAGPYGEVKSYSPEAQEDVYLAECDPALLEEFRRNWPYFRDRRIDAYGAITQRWLD